MTSAPRAGGSSLAIAPGVQTPSGLRALWPRTRARAFAGVAAAVLGPVLVALAAELPGSPVDTFPGTFVLVTVIVAVLIGRLLVGILSAVVGFVVLAVAFVGTPGELSISGESFGALLGFAAAAVMVSHLLAGRDAAREDRKSNV